MAERGARQQAAAAQLDERELAAWRGFLRTHARLVHELDAELQAQSGLALTAYEVLMYLLDAPGMRLRMSELADRLLLTAGGVTRLVERLTRAGLVRKEPCLDDRRGFYATLTELGEERACAARAVHLAGVRRRFLEHLEPRQLDQLAAVWARVAPG